MSYENKLLTAILILIGLGIGLIVVDANQAATFIKENHCVKSGYQTGSTGTGISASGNVVIVSNPGKTIYKCDNDFTYIR